MKLRSIYISKGVCALGQELFCSTLKVPLISTGLPDLFDVPPSISSACYLSDFSKTLGQFPVKVKIHSFNIPNRERVILLSVISVFMGMFKYLQHIFAILQEILLINNNESLPLFQFYGCQEQVQNYVHVLKQDFYEKRITVCLKMSCKFEVNICIFTLSKTLQLRESSI